MKLSRLAGYKKRELRNQLVEVLEKLGYAVIFDRGDFSNGACKVYEDNRVVINKFFPIDVHLEFLLDFLSEKDLSKIYLLPSVRELIESRVKK
ncbi:MAG: hypothetical protein H0Z29_02570 [Candidatus Marinimicrobia bacterium]|nr:hypothetical protein [Candidatus Neomarinimicrobiota bacterium]